MAFYAVIYDAGLRPEEAVILRRDDLRIPALVENQATGRRKNLPTTGVSFDSAQWQPR